MFKKHGEKEFLTHYCFEKLGGYGGLYCSKD